MIDISIYLKQLDDLRYALYKRIDGYYVDQYGNEYMLPEKIFELYYETGLIFYTTIR